jgi:hypothetical protein
LTAVTAFVIFVRVLSAWEMTAPIKRLMSKILKERMIKMEGKPLKGYHIIKHVDDIQPTILGDKFGQLVIKVLPDAHNDHTCNETFDLVWQCNLNSPEHQAWWYDFHFDVRTNAAKTIILAAKMARDLSGRSNYLSGYQPDTIVEYLKQHGYAEVVYHKGMSRYYRADRVPQKCTWANILPGTKYYGACVVANNQNKALRLLKKEAKQAISMGYDVDHWKEWLKNPDCFPYWGPERLGPMSLAIHEKSEDVAVG